MLRDEGIVLRPMREDDLDTFYHYHQELQNRGDYFPTGVMAKPVLRSKFHETGFWQDEQGMLLITTEDDQIIGRIEYFPTVSYLDELEISYHVYSGEHEGKGVATKALKLLTGYLFDRKRQNRIRLIIHPENEASKRVAEKAGYGMEAVARGAWFHQGRSHDVEVHALLRQERYGEAG